MRVAFVAILILCSQLWAVSPELEGPAITVGKIEPVVVRQGETAWARISIIVAPGLHVNANPAASEMYIPLEIQLGDARGVHAGTPDYPPGVRWQLEGGEDTLLVYGGKIEVRVPVIAEPKAKKGRRELRGTIEYQACDDRMCLLPASRPIAISVRVVKR